MRSVACWVLVVGYGFVAASGVGTRTAVGEEGGARDPPAMPQVDGRTAAQWTEDLASADLKTRQKAAYALWKLGPDAPASGLALAFALLDQDSYVRTTSAKALSKSPNGLAEAGDVLAAALGGIL